MSWLHENVIRDEAYERAAKLLEGESIREPEGEVEEHVNEVLHQLAAQIRALKAG